MSSCSQGMVGLAGAGWQLQHGVLTGLSCRPLSTCQSHPGMPASAEGMSVTVTVAVAVAMAMTMTVTVAMAGGCELGHAPGVVDFGICFQAVWVISVTHWFWRCLSVWLVTVCVSA